MAAWDLTEVTDYIRLNTLDNEDFLEADDDRKTALLNVADRTLRQTFPDLDDEDAIPSEAVYLTANRMASAYNDTMKQAQRGVSSFSIDGINFTFMDWAQRDLADFIPDEVYDMLGKPRMRALYTTL